jgi:hypothetical protein
MEELIERVKASEPLKSVWRQDPQSIQWKEASKLNKILTGLPLNTSAKCDCIEDLFFLLKRENIIEKIEQKMEKKFFLKKGKLLQSADFANVGEQSSDELMIKALKRSPGLIKHFKTVPDNWREICGLDEEKATEGKETEGKSLYDSRKEALMPFWEFMKEDHLSIDFGALPKESFDIILQEVEEAFDKAQEEQLLNASKGTEDLGKPGDSDANKSDEGKEESKEINSKTDEKSTVPTFDELNVLQVSQLRQLMIDKNVEIPKNISRKKDLIDFIIKLG